ncbi:rhomboid family intramembrane serine protease [Chryseobacterium viscerum]|uniref:Rhomboid family intramembrane serine protease n=1 Tax=Chryseobacterium viscerum TaxID=1037377 RepID=A0A316WNA1_9FLAO|nr:rhomboid family intramembrane serine protease [Chryseobacterium viscerum]PWN62677.1 rhomboid family intramembrane serine protease [Chryseobacterium viscerum]
MKDKLQFIYKPFLLIALGFILSYTFLNWFLFMKIGIPLKEDIVEFWLPIGLSSVLILICLRPRIKLLKFKNENSSFVYQLLACIAIAIPTIIAQKYLVTATGKLTNLNVISELPKKDNTKYYTLKNYYIDKHHIAIQNTVSTSGRNNEHFNMLIYVTMPILESASDTINKTHKYWLGKLYSEQISNSLSDEKKKEKYKLLAERSQKEFENTDFHKFIYLENIGNTEDHDEYNKALEKIEQNLSHDNIIFEARTEPFETRNGNKFFWVLGSFGIGAFVYFLLLLFPKFHSSKLENFKKKGITEIDSDIKEILDMFIPKEGFFITPILIDFNLLIYLLMVFSGLGLVSFKSDDLLNWGANFRPSTIDNQWWRLLTNIFLHGGLMHIFVNMVGLLFVGIFLEPLLGRGKYLLIYLITGILASFTSIWWYDATVSVGASGAIFGLYGFFIACMLFKVFSADFSKAFLISTLVFVGFNLLMGFTGGIDNAAHIGGLVAGFIIGMILSGRLKKGVEPTAEHQSKEDQPN